MRTVRKIAFEFSHRRVNVIACFAANINSRRIIKTVHVSFYISDSWIIIHARFRSFDVEGNQSIVFLSLIKSVLIILYL